MESLHPTAAKAGGDSLTPRGCQLIKRDWRFPHRPRKSETPSREAHEDREGPSGVLNPGARGQPSSRGRDDGELTWLCDREVFTSRDESERGKIYSCSPVT